VQCGDARPNAAVVGDGAVGQRDVEVAADQDALAREVTECVDAWQHH